MVIRKCGFLILLILSAGTLLTGCSGNNSPSTPNNLPTSTPAANTATAVYTPTITLTFTASNTATRTFTATNTGTPTATATPANTSTFTPTSTASFTFTSTFTSSFTPTSTNSPTATFTATATHTPPCSPGTKVGLSTSSATSGYNAGQVYCMVVTVTTGLTQTAFQLGLNFSNGGAPLTFQAGIYNDTGSHAPGTLLSASVTLVNTVSGFQAIDIPSSALANNGVYWLSFLPLTSSALFKVWDATTTGVPSVRTSPSMPYTALPGDLTGLTSINSTTGISFYALTCP